MTEKLSGLHISNEESEKFDLEKREQDEEQEKKKNVPIVKRINDWLISKSKVKSKSKVSFYRLLATMINAGVSIVKSLHILEEQIEDPKLKIICGTIAVDVEKGQTLSSSMTKFPDVFMESQIGMVKSGEVSGNMNQILSQIADQVEKSSKIAGKIKGAMMYPIAILLVLVVVVIAVIIMVIPNLKDVFGQAGKELPASTKMLIAVSDYLTGNTFGIPNWMNLALFAFIFVFLLNLWKRTESGKYLWHKFLLKIPIFGGLNQKVALSKFCDSISILTKSGISIVRALNLTADIIGNEVYRRRVLMTAEDVEQGLTIAENIRDDKNLFPSVVVSMVSVGEQTAQLDKVTSKIAEFYDDEANNIVKNLSSLMEPIIILVIGVAVGFLVAAIMTPIMQMSETISA